MADPGINIRLNPAFADFVADPGLFAHTTIPVGSTWEKRNFFPFQRNVPGGPNNAGGGATNGIIITANGVNLTRSMWLDARPEIKSELGVLVDSGKILVIDIATGIQLTPEEIQLQDLPQTVQQATGVVAINNNPAADGAGVDVRGYGFVIRVTPTVTPADATFQVWAFQRTDSPAAGNGVWSAVGDPVQINTNQSTFLEVSTDIQTLASRVYVEVQTYVSGTWTLDVVRRVLFM
jgi:hypothetical protein